MGCRRSSCGCGGCGVCIPDGRLCEPAVHVHAFPDLLAAIFRWRFGFRQLLRQFRERQFFEYALVWLRRSGFRRLRNDAFFGRLRSARIFVGGFVRWPGQRRCDDRSQRRRPGTGRRFRRFRNRRGPGRRKRRPAIRSSGERWPVRWSERHGGRRTDAGNSHARHWIGGCRRTFAERRSRHNGRIRRGRRWFA